MKKIVLIIIGLIILVAAVDKLRDKIQAKREATAAEITLNKLLTVPEGFKPKYDSIKLEMFTATGCLFITTILELDSSLTSQEVKNNVMFHMKSVYKVHKNAKGFMTKVVNPGNNSVYYTAIFAPEGDYINPCDHDCSLSNFQYKVIYWGWWHRELKE